MAFTKYKQVMLQDTRDIITGLWRVPLQRLDRTTHQINNIHKVNGKENTIKYLHATALIPVQKTWSRDVNKG